MAAVPPQPTLASRSNRPEEAAPQAAGTPPVTSGTGGAPADAHGRAGAPRHFPRLTEQELFERLGWFVSIRWLAGAAALLLVLLGWYGFGVRIPPKPVLIIVWGMFLYNAFFLLICRDAYGRQTVSRRFIVGCANAQIVCDLLALAVLMHYTGGVENPFLIFAICPLVIASELLPARHAYAYAALGALLVHAVAWSEYAGWLRHVPVGAALGAAFYSEPLAVATTTGSLTLLAFATVFLGSSIATRLRLREAELEAAYEQLHALERSKSFLMRQTSHDLRAPLDALIAMLRAVTMAAAGHLEPRLAELLTRAEQRALALTHLIDELHRYAVLRENPTLRREPVSLADTVTQSVRLYNLMADEKDLKITSSVEPVWVRGDPDALNEVLSNLLANAIQYTPPGGAISVRLRAEENTALLEVADTGIGIPADALERVFDEFYRAPNAKAAFRTGTGMGLPIVKRIVETHGGAISVSSSPGRGSVFSVRLPIPS